MSMHRCGQRERFEVREVHQTAAEKHLEHLGVDHDSCQAGAWRLAFPAKNNLQTDGSLGE